MVTHDLRSPMQGIAGFFELVESGLIQVTPAQGQQLAARGRISSMRMVSLMNDLLDMEKINSNTVKLELEEINVDSAFAEVQQIVQESANRSNVRVVFSETGMNITIDHQSLTRILLNLVTNAIKFSPPGSTVTIGALQPQSSSEEFVEFFVQDNGRGIPADKLEMVFQRFQQVKVADATEKGGSGLGLAICKSLVELHGGTIGVDSTDGKGCRFWFRIPNVPKKDASGIISEAKTSGLPNT